MEDIRDIIFKDIKEQEFKGILIPESNGCLSGVNYAISLANEIGINIEFYYKEGSIIEKGKPIGIITATPKNMAKAEEKIIGCLAKFSGIATAAKKAVDIAKGEMEIVAGSWKKLPHPIKDGVRTAIVSGGATFRISNNKMIYMDKNYIKMLGSIINALEATKEFEGYTRVIQIKGKDNSIENETKMAIEHGCDLLMVDTGNIEDLTRCLNYVNELGARNKVEIAFAGGVKIEDITKLAEFDIDKLCIGKEIVDALLLDIKLDVI